MLGGLNFERWFCFWGEFEGFMRWGVLVCFFRLKVFGYVFWGWLEVAVEVVIEKMVAGSVTWFVEVVPKVSQKVLQN